MGQSDILCENIYGEQIAIPNQILQPRKSVYGIIPVQNKILLVQQHGGLWEIPGGKIEMGETPRQALVRELQEEVHPELRVNISSAKSIFRRQYNFLSPYGQAFDSLQRFYVLAPPEQDIEKLIQGSDLVRLASPDEVSAKELNHSALLAWEAYIQFLFDKTHHRYLR
jgi:8-oxo-dGTP pyrophosphatase MutT (NUDIX family)